MDPFGRWMVVGLRLSLELFFLKVSQDFSNQRIQSTSLVPGSGLGTEGLGTAVLLAPELTVRAGR